VCKKTKPALAPAAPQAGISKGKIIWGKMIEKLLQKNFLLFCQKFLSYYHRSERP
jgi:hypothetical protein